MGIPWEEGNLFGISFPATAVGPRIFSHAVGKNLLPPPLGAKSRDVLATVAFLCAMSNRQIKSTYLAKQRKTGFDNNLLMATLQCSADGIRWLGIKQQS